MSAPRSIITIADTDRLHHVMKACDFMPINDFTTNKISALTAVMQNALVAKLPAISDKSQPHPLPAYLAANQIGLNKQAVLVYLPPKQNKPAEQIMMFNPSYRIIEEYPAGSQPQFRISTFLAEQFRFSNHCYAKRIVVDYDDQHWNSKSLRLENLDAIAAQMGINFIHGTTPLDHKISPQALLNFANGSEQEKIILTKKAYELHGRNAEIDMRKFQFGNSQVEHIPGFLKLRENFKILHNPSTGNLLADEKTAENAVNTKSMMTL